MGSPERTADEEPNDDAGLELKGEENGLVRCAGEMLSPKGSVLLLLSGVPGRIGVVAVETVENPPFPLYCEWLSILCTSAKAKAKQDQGEESILEIKFLVIPKQDRGST